MSAVEDDQLRLTALTEALVAADLALSLYATEVAARHDLGERYYEVKHAGMSYGQSLAEIIQMVRSQPQHNSPMFLKLVERDGEFCQECGVAQGLEMDHVMPRALGGGDALVNRQLLCRGCNSRKSSKHPDVWRSEVDARRALAGVPG